MSIHNVSLGAGEINISTGTFGMPAASICAARCVSFRLEARDRADAARVDTGPFRGCVL